MKKLGVIDARREQYSTSERLHLIRCLSTWPANLYIYGQLTWGKTIRPICGNDLETFRLISNQCKKYNIELWAWMRPGSCKFVQIGQVPAPTCQ